MIQPSIILSSKSPRRKFLLEQANIRFEIASFEVEENVPDHIEISKAPEYLSLKKAKYALSQLDTEKIILSADTSVFLHQEILNKPADKVEATHMIRKLSGKEHTVITGVTLINQSKIVSFSVTSEVTLDTLSEAEIEYYIDTYQPYDKAGSYGIQDWIGWVKINSIRGSYSNILGLPMREVYRELKAFIAIQ